MADVNDGKPEFCINAANEETARWRIGILEYWISERMGYRSGGVMGFKTVLQCSKTPSFQSALWI
jgi:hypothetical protein